MTTLPQNPAPSQQVSSPDFFEHPDVYEIRKKLFNKEPKPLVTLNTRPREFPIEALCPTLRKAALAIEDMVDCPKAIAANSVLAAASLAVQAHYDVVLPFGGGTRRPLSLFFLTIGESNERKSTADDIALKPIIVRQNELQEMRDAEMPRYIAANKAWEAENRKIANDKDLSLTEKTKALLALGLKPASPPSARLTTKEPTIEGLKKLFRYGQPSLGLMSAEGGSFVGGHGLTEEARLRTATTLCDFWDGNTVYHDRAAEDESFLLQGKRLTFHLMVQPVVANKFLTIPELRGQGIFSRMLIAYPESTIGTRLHHELEDNTLADIQAYSNQLLQILRTNLPLAMDKDNELRPQEIQFTPEAVEAWWCYYNGIETEQGEDGEYSSIKGIAGKILENVSRIAAIMALVENGPNSVITMPILDEAMTIGKYFLNEAIWLSESNGTANSKLDKTQRLLDWLLSWDGCKDQTISISAIRAHGPREFRAVKKKDNLSEDDVNLMMEILTEHGYLYNYHGNKVSVYGHNTEKAWIIRKLRG